MKCPFILICSSQLRHWRMWLIVSLYFRYIEENVLAKQRCNKEKPLLWDTPADVGCILSVLRSWRAQSTQGLHYLKVLICQKCAHIASINDLTQPGVCNIHLVVLSHLSTCDEVAITHIMMRSLTSLVFTQLTSGGGTLILIIMPSSLCIIVGWVNSTLYGELKSMLNLVVLWIGWGPSRGNLYAIEGFLGELYFRCTDLLKKHIA